MRYHFVSSRSSRAYMEDRYLLPTSSVQLFAVFDGHGGSASAEWCATHAEQMFTQLLLKNNGNAILAFDALFTKLQASLVPVAERSGTTATFVYIDGQYVTTANVGDSSAVLCRTESIVELTANHRAGEDVIETQMVLEDGGTFIGKRVNGCLSLTRSLGDFSFYPAVSYQPRVAKMKISNSDRYIILASDGLWDVVEVDTLLDKLDWVSNDPAHMCDILAEAADRSRDNYTIGIISLETNNTSSSGYTFYKELQKTRLGN